MVTNITQTNNSNCFQTTQSNTNESSIHEIVSHTHSHIIPEDSVHEVGLADLIDVEWSDPRVANRYMPTVIRHITQFAKELGCLPSEAEIEARKERQRQINEKYKKGLQEVAESHEKKLKEIHDSCQLREKQEIAWHERNYEKQQEEQRLHVERMNALFAAHQIEQEGCIQEAQDQLNALEAQRRARQQRTPSHAPASLEPTPLHPPSDLVQQKKQILQELVTQHNMPRHHPSQNVREIQQRMLSDRETHRWNVTRQIWLQERSWHEYGRSVVRSLCLRVSSYAQHIRQSVMRSFSTSADNTHAATDIAPHDDNSDGLSYPCGLSPPISCDTLRWVWARLSAFFAKIKDWIVTTKPYTYTARRKVF